MSGATGVVERFQILHLLGSRQAKSSQILIGPVEGGAPVRSTPTPAILAVSIVEPLGSSGGLRLSHGLILESLHRQIKRGDLCRHRFVLAA